MAKHSQGPWYIQRDSYGHPGVRNDHGFICFTGCIHHYEGQDERYSQEIAEREADARLIAAAPDLLKILKAIIDYDGEDGVPGIHALMETALAIVNRAEATP